MVRRVLSLGMAVGLTAVMITGSASATPASTQHVAVPAYWGADATGAALWRQLAGGTPTANLAILGIEDSGPGSAPRPEFQNVVRDTRSAGVRVISYVDTNYTKRSMSQVKADIRNSFSWYNVDGIFLDQASNTCDRLSYYRTLYNYVKSLRPNATVVLNPGINTPECYVSASDILLNFESYYSDYVGWSPDGWEFNYPASRFWHLIIGVSSTAQLQDAVAKSKQRNAGYVYVTNDDLPNPWDTLPPYWQTELSAVRGSAALAAVTIPPANAKFDYQIGAPYPPPAGVRVLDRDREQAPVNGLYNICYVNGYQTQPGEIDWWKANHDDLLLKDARGNYVIDSDWGEILLDIRTAAKRNALAGIIGSWIDGCRDHGFQAIEPDNLDSWTRSQNLLTQQNAVDFARLLATRAHTDGVAIAQKNTAEIADIGRSIGFDFAVAEECGRYNECSEYTAGFGNNVIVIEYRRQDFTKACSKWGAQLSVVLRDRNVTAPGSATYQYDAC